MRTSSWCWVLVLPQVALFALFALLPPPARSACCYFAAKDKDILQPAQKAFITWDPVEKVESFTVQPKFEGNAADFGMVIPTPSRPKLDEMPRDFFKELAVFTLLKKREQPESSLLTPLGGLGGFRGGFAGGLGGGFGMLGGVGGLPMTPAAVRVLESGIVGALDYKILSADRADELYTWLKENKYSFSGDEATLDHYVKKGWVFTVMKIDTMQMKRRPDGSFDGEVTPTRFQFASEKLVYPLKITQINVLVHTEALFYVQAPLKTDLPGDWTYQYQWLPMLENAQGSYAKGMFGTHDLPGKGDEWLEAAQDQLPTLHERAEKLGFNFVSGQRPERNKDGHTATTLEWAKRLTAADIQVLRGEKAFGEQVPDVDEGFTQADLKEEGRAAAVRKVIAKRLEQCRTEHPGGYLVREAPAVEVKGLKLLVGHLKEGQFLTKIHKTFARDEMDDDLLIVPARLGKAEDQSEYEEVLPTSPP